MNFAKLFILFLTITVLSPMISADKVAVIGWDGADWNRIEPLLEKGEMPNLEKLIKEGQRGDLESVEPVMSPVAWSSYATGSNPSIHGIYDFLQYKNGEFTPMTSRDIEKPYFWQQTDSRSVVVNMPMTFPPRETDGALVSGYLASNDTTYTSPPELTRELNQKGYIIEALSEGYSPDDPDRTVEKSDKAVEKRTEIALDLYSERKPEFFQVTYTGLDRLQHYFPLEPDSSDKGVVPDHYRKLDRELGRIRADLDNDTKVVVMSDHGFQKLDKQIYLNHWMKEKGYLEMKGSKSPLQKIGITQQRIAPILRDLGLLETAKTVLNMLGMKPSESVPQPGMNSIDMETTRAYAGNYGGAVHIVEENVDDVEEFRKRLKSELESLEIEEEAAFKQVKLAEEVYETNEQETPDILTRARPGLHVVGFLGKGKLYTEDNKKSGVHRKQGIIITDIDNAELDDAKITDVAPTVLEILEESSPDYMTGESLVK